MTARAAACDDEDWARAGARPSPLFGFDSLVAGAARPRPAALAFCDTIDGVTDQVRYADLYERVGACLSRLRTLPLPRGERAILCGAFGAQGFAVLTATLAAGLEPVLAPPPTASARAAIAAAAKDLSARAIFAPAQLGGVNFAGSIFEIAAQAPSVRLIGALTGALDGATDFSAAAPAARAGARLRLFEDWGCDEAARIGALDDAGGVRFVSQGALLGAALDLVRITRPMKDRPILSLCGSTSPAALVAGPLAALLAGAPLYTLAPFVSAHFRETLDALGPARLVAPASALRPLYRAGFLHNGALAGVIAIAGEQDLDAVDSACPLVILRDAGGSIVMETHARAHSETGAAAE